MPDTTPQPCAGYADPRVARVYDSENAGRDDIDHYVALAARLGARDVLDIGCGTGVLCADLARAGHGATGVDPSDAMLAVARSRPGGDLVRWVRGTAADVPAATADLVVMTGHVAQYFVDDDAWADVLRHAHRALCAGGHLAFEVRDPDAREWERWTEPRTRATYPHPDGGRFDAWVQLVGVAGDPRAPIETHEGHVVLPDGLHLVAAETLRFRTREEVEASLDRAGFELLDTWGGWQREPVGAGSGEIVVLAARR